jgi:phosphoketolase
MDESLSPDLLRQIDTCRRTANCLSDGQIYRYDDRMEKRPMKFAAVLHVPLGYCGKTFAGVDQKVWH